MSKKASLSETSNSPEEEAGANNVADSEPPTDKLEVEEEEEEEDEDKQVEEEEEENEEEKDNEKEEKNAQENEEEAEEGGEEEGEEEEEVGKVSQERSLKEGDLNKKFSKERMISENVEEEIVKGGVSKGEAEEENREGEQEEKEEMEGICNANDPCCSSRPAQNTTRASRAAQLNTQNAQAPKNPLHFENLIGHRLQLKEVLQAARKRQSEESEPQRTGQVAESSSRVAASKGNATSDSDEKRCIPPLNPELIPIEELIESLDGIKFMALAHEIAINNEFKFENLNKPINEQAEIALRLKDKYWQKIDQALIRKRKNMKEAKGIIIDLICTLKRMLLGTILPHNYTMKLHIHHILNIYTISKEIDANTFDFDKYMHFILDTLSTLCCPIRDEVIIEIRDMMSAKVPISRQAHMAVDLMEAMNLDMANFVISQSRPHLVHNCVVYERQQFKKYVAEHYLRRGRDPLKITRQWICGHCIPGRDFKETMACAFLELFEKEEDDVSNWPETLALDWFRIPAVRQEVNRLVIVGAMVSSVYNFVKSLNPVPDSSGKATDNFEESQLAMLKNLKVLRTLRDELNATFKADMIKDPENLQKVFNECSEKAIQVVDNYRTVEHCDGLTEAQKSAIAQLTSSFANKNHPIRLNYLGLVKEWFIQVAKNEGRGTLEVPPYLRDIGPLLLTPITQMLNILMYNRTVFDGVYKEIYSGNCPPPSFFPTVFHPTTGAVVLDANIPDKKYDSPQMDEGIGNILRQLEKDVKDTTSMVYRKSQVDPKVQPLYNADGTIIKPPELQEMNVEPEMTPLEQERYDEFLLANEPTLEVDHEGIYDGKMKADEGFRVFNRSSEQLRIMERENIIRANKLRRIKKSIQESNLKKRVANNLPVFDKKWRQEVGYLQKEFCRLERIYEKGFMPLPETAQDEPREKRVFQGACQNPDRKSQDVGRKSEAVEYNERGERIIYSRNRGQAFAPLEEVNKDDEYDFSRFTPDSD